MGAIRGYGPGFQQGLLKATKVAPTLPSIPQKALDMYIPVIYNNVHGKWFCQFCGLSVGPGQ